MICQWCRSLLQTSGLNWRFPQLRPSRRKLRCGVFQWRSAGSGHLSKSTPLHREVTFLQNSADCFSRQLPCNIHPNPISHQYSTVLNTNLLVFLDIMTILSLSLLFQGRLRLDPMVAYWQGSSIRTVSLRTRSVWRLLVQAVVPQMWSTSSFWRRKRLGSILCAKRLVFLAKWWSWK